MVDRARPVLILSVVYLHFYYTGIPLHQCKLPMVLPCHDQCRQICFYFGWNSYTKHSWHGQIPVLSA